MELPQIGFGTWQILLNGKAKRAVSEALKTGYRLIDTAMVYGNEKGVGAAIAETSIPRSEIIVTTKLWNFDQGYEKALAAFDTSLGRLSLDYIDLYLIHWPQNSQLTRESWRAMEELQRTGLIKHIGVSNFDEQQLAEFTDFAEIMPKVNQIEFHPFIFEQQRPILEYCAKHGIIVEAYSPLARGKGLKHAVIAQVARETDRTAGQVMLRWAVQHGTVPLPKTTHVERMQENFNIFDFELTAAQMHNLNQLSTGQSVL